MKLLLTGFGPFGNVAVNPSQLIVESMVRETKTCRSIDLVAQVLPMEYIKAGNLIGQLIREHRPERVICLGVATGIESIHLERIALNLDNTDSADNANMIRVGKPILPEGPAAYWSTLPIEEMREELRQRGFPAIISNHAGTYVCNHVFYLARHEIELLGSGSPCGFIHLPQVAQEARGESQLKPVLSLKEMMAAVECCIGIAISTPPNA